MYILWVWGEGKKKRGNVGIRTRGLFTFVTLRFFFDLQVRDIRTFLFRPERAYVLFDLPSSLSKRPPELIGSERPAYHAAAAPVRGINY